MQMFKTATKRTLFGGGLGLAAIAGSLAVAMAFAQPAQAATETGNFQVQITIEAACTVQSTNLLDFGRNGLLGADIDGTAQFDVLCTDTTPYDIGLDKGTTTGGSTTTRLMTNGTDTVSYQMFSDSARLVNWGETIDTDAVAGIGTGVAQTLTIYGRVPAQLSVPSGTYTDTVTITITF